MGSLRGVLVFVGEFDQMHVDESVLYVFVVQDRHNVKDIFCLVEEVIAPFFFKNFPKGEVWFVERNEDELGLLVRREIEISEKYFGKEAGTVKLSIRADPESSLNPAYLSVKLEADTTPPSIGTPSQDPPEDNVQPNQAVTVSVNVTDTESGVRNVTISYSTNEGAIWTNVTMSKLTGDAYVGEIPELSAGTNIRYKIFAYDNAGNFAVDDKAGQYYVYTVIPEFPTWPLFLLTIILLATAIIFVKKKLKHARERDTLILAGLGPSGTAGSAYF